MVEDDIILLYLFLEGFGGNIGVYNVKFYYIIGSYFIYLNINIYSMYVILLVFFIFYLILEKIIFNILYISFY